VSTYFNNFAKSATSYSLIASAVCALATTTAFAQAISNQDVILMLNARISDTVIIARINSASAQIDTSTQAVIDLARAGASDEVMAAVMAKGSQSGASSRTQPTRNNPVAEFQVADVEFASISVSPTTIRLNVRIKNKHTNPLYAYGNTDSNIVYGGGGNLAKCQSVSLTDDLGNDFACASQTLNGYIETTGYGTRDYNGKVISPNQKIAVQYVFTIPSGTRVGNRFSVSADPYVVSWDNLNHAEMIQRQFGTRNSISFSFDDLQKTSVPAQAQARR
jgi:hypothetical protein